ncbi:cyclic nucleotide-binding domain-containing protein [Pedobacter hartonius]
MILSGIFRMFYLDELGKEYIVQFAGANWWMSDYQSYFNKKKTCFYLQGE